MQYFAFDEVVIMMHNDGRNGWIIMHNYGRKEFMYGKSLTLKFYIDHITNKFENHVTNFCSFYRHLDCIVDTFNKIVIGNPSSVLSRFL